MSEISVRFIRNHPNAKIPTRAYERAACYDLYSLCEYTLAPLSSISVSTGIQIEMPGDCEGIIRGRSGLARQGILTHIGTIDPDYRGEIGPIMYNFSSEPFVIKIGDKICQIAIREFSEVQFVEVESLSESLRGEKGFGSSGR